MSALQFPSRKIVTIPHDPIAHATGAVKAAADDFIFAISEAFNAEDAEGLADLCVHITTCCDALTVVAAMAEDFSSRMIKER